MSMRLVYVLLATIALAGTANARTRDSIELQLKRMADTTRMSLPMMVNDNVQATNISSVGKILMNRYNFITRRAVLGDIGSLKSEYYNNSVNAACTNPETISAFNSGVSFDYQYYDSANEFVMQYALDANTCKARK
jgi:hypothetical protein